MSEATTTQADQGVLPTFTQAMNNLRSVIGELGEDVKSCHQHPVFSDPVKGPDHGEMHANIMLAYRHMEDARMRLGKAIQAFDGGVSVYDANKPTGMAEQDKVNTDRDAEEATPELEEKPPVDDIATPEDELVD